MLATGSIIEGMTEENMDSRLRGNDKGVCCVGERGFEDY